MSETNDDRLKKKRRSGLGLAFLFIFSFLVAGLFILLEREKPQITIPADFTRTGATLSLPLSATDKRSGLKSVSVQLTQTEKDIVKGPTTKNADLLAREFPRQGYFFNAGPKSVDENISVDIASLGFRDGEATLRVTVRDFSFWNWSAGNESVFEIPLAIDITPPRVTTVETPKYIRPGGSGLVVYKINEPARSHGVTVNNHFYPGYPLDADKNDLYVSFIGLAHDTTTLTTAVVSASDRVGNEGRSTFVMNLIKIKEKAPRTIQISDSFLNEKLPEFAEKYPELKGSPVEQYIYVNTEIRNANNAQIKEICSKSSDNRQWSGLFQRMPRSMEMAHFADFRNYYYQGEKIDSQYHLGYDLASTSRAPIHPANSGTVVFAEYLGIYGNTVIVDHGQGLFSLYSHLSQIEVDPGTIVTTETLLGSSGTTGMAGGDHLHFSILINGIFVSPLEWWDRPWVTLHILSPLGEN